EWLGHRREQLVEPRIASRLRIVLARLTRRSREACTHCNGKGEPQSMLPTAPEYQSPSDVAVPEMQCGGSPSGKPPRCYSTGPRPGRTDCGGPGRPARVDPGSVKRGSSPRAGLDR